MSLKPYYGPHAGVTIYNADALEALRSMPDESVNCCITSPPYWGLRDYGTAAWSGGLPDCDHTYNHGAQGTTGQRADRTFTAQAVYKDECRRCGAKRVDKQIGLEATPQEFVAKMVAVFDEVRRVLKPDGNLWLNLGDSYSAHPGQRKETDAAGPKQRTNEGAQGAPSRCVDGLKPKDLVGIPWRVAFALQDAGWWLRSDIIWAKPAPMPESVTDRPTRSHEYIFLLARSEKYYFDADAIKEPVSGTAHARGNGINPKCTEPGAGVKMNTSFSAAVNGLVDFRNKRDVWTVNTDPFPEAHFATFPPALILPCVLAGCPAGGLVLDPFMGAATTALVAKENGRRAVGSELSAEYCAIAARRLSQEVLQFGT